MNLLRRIAIPAAVLGIALSGIVAPSASAAQLKPADVSHGVAEATITEGVKFPGEPDPAWRKTVQSKGDRVQEMWARSPAMNRDIPLVVIKAKPESGPRPTIYLLNGADGGEGRANWVMQTDAIDFYLDKDVNVVIPMSGKFSYYTDWVEDIPALGGPQKWETFLTKELPGSIEKKLNASNKRAIVGMSMSATTPLLFAEHYPGFYDAVGSFSGCAATSGPISWEFLRRTFSWGGIPVTPEQMWGPQGGEYSRYNDALLNAEKLRGTEIYVSNGNGMSGHWESPDSPRYEGLNPIAKPLAMGETSIIGGIIESGTNLCTHQFKTTLDRANIKADFVFRNAGTHSWGWWHDDLRNSWPTLDRALNN